MLYTASKEIGRDPWHSGVGAHINLKWKDSKTLPEARINAISLMTEVGEKIYIDKSLDEDRVYTIEEIICQRADKFDDRTGRIKKGYEYIIKKIGSRGHEYYYISRKTGKILGRAYGVSGFF